MYEQSLTLQGCFHIQLLKQESFSAVWVRDVFVSEELVFVWAVILVHEHDGETSNLQRTSMRMDFLFSAVENIFWVQQLKLF